MRAGDLDTLIVIQKRLEVRESEYGSIETTWREYAQFWADIRSPDVKNLEVIENYISNTGAKRATNRLNFIIRYDSDITVFDFRVKYENKFYDIIRCRQIGRRDGLELEGVCYE